jgi:hypothetical protein
MSFGKFHPAKKSTLKTIDGETKTVDTPAGYGGLFWGYVYNSQEKVIPHAEDYFLELGEKNDPSDQFKYWDIIDHKITSHCLKYIDPYCGANHHYQSGFGGDEGNGLIDFWTEKRIPEMPDLEFEIEGEKYTIKWLYSSGGYESSDDDSSESCSD